MPEQLSLVIRDDFMSDLYTLDLLPWRARDAWQMSLGDGYTPVDEALTIHVPGDTDDALALNIQALDALILRIARRHETNDGYSVWLRHQLAGETGMRQALILEARRDKARVTDLMIKEHYLRDYVLGITRAGAWEKNGYETRESGTISTIGGRVNLSRMYGDLPARLARVSLLDTQGGATPFRDVYVGLRSNRFALAANFLPLWEAEFGHVTAGAAIIDDEDETASGGQEIEYTETPAVAAGGFSIAQPRVKPGGIVVTATIDGEEYVLADHWPPYNGILSAWGQTAENELQDDHYLDEHLPSPNTIHFFAAGLDFARDNGLGGLIQEITQGNDTWLDSGGGGTFNAARFPVRPNTITGHVSHLTDELDFTDDGAGGLWYEVDDPAGTINYETGEVTFVTAAGSTIALRYWADFQTTTGTIDYLTGEWHMSDVLDGDITASYNYGSPTCTFNYTAGAGQFDQAYLHDVITALSVTYTGYHNKCVRVTFSDSSMQVRWYMSLSEVTEFPADQRGNMLVLARLKVSDNSTYCRVRLDSGYDGTTAFSKSGKVTVSGDEWALYSLGKIMRSDRQGAQLSSLSQGSFRLRLAADRYAGTGTLDIDCLVMIPIDEGFIHIEARSGLGAGFYDVTITQSADGQVNVACFSSEGVPIYSDIVPELSGGFPLGENVHAIVAANRNPHSNDIADGLAVKFDVYPRWVTLRGAA